MIDIFPEITVNIVGLLIVPMNFVDTLAQTGTTAASVDGLLEAEEQHHGNEKVSF